MKTTILNLVYFNVAWLICVGSAAANMPVYGLIAVLMVAAWHLSVTAHPRAEAALLVVAAGVGFAWETALVAAAVLEYPTGMLVDGIAPYWIVALWVLFATTLNVGMRWLRRSPALAVLAGAVGGPLSFVAGERLGAVTFADPVSTPIILGAGWAILMPALIFIARHFEESVAKESPAGLRA